MSEATEPDVPVERDINWTGVAAVGFLLIGFGVFAAPIVASFGMGMILVGAFVIFAAGIARRWEGSPEVFTDLDYRWEQEMEARLYENEIRSRYEERQKQVEEIVKAVKETIRVRCRYCGTLNEEKANKCESCGGSL